MYVTFSISCSVVNNGCQTILTNVSHNQYTIGYYIATSLPTLDC